MSDVTFAADVMDADGSKCARTSRKHVLRMRNGLYVAMASRGIGKPALGWVDDTIEKVAAAMKVMRDTGHWPDGKELPI